MAKVVKKSRTPRKALQCVYGVAFAAVEIDDRCGEVLGRLRDSDRELKNALETIRKHFKLKEVEG